MNAIRYTLDETNDVAICFTLDNKHPYSTTSHSYNNSLADVTFMPVVQANPVALS